MTINGDISPRWVRIRGVPCMANWSSRTGCWTITCPRLHLHVYAQALREGDVWLNIEETLKEAVNSVKNEL